MIVMYYQNCLFITSRYDRNIIVLMADNGGVDVKPIASTNQVRNMWEQNIIKKKQEAEEARKVPLPKNTTSQQPTSPIKTQETKPVVV